MPEVSELEKKLLDLISGKESGGKYDALYPGSRDSVIPQLTLGQVDEFQTRRINSGIKSSAIGRYQFIRKTLRGAKSVAGIADSVQFNPSIQDYLMISVLRSSRGLDRWKAGSLSDADFCLNLAKEFASVPVPYDTEGAHRFVSKGETYYAGDGLNRSGHNADAFVACLEDIRNGGEGNIETIEFVESDATNLSAGSTPRTASEIQAGGGQRLVGGNPADRPLVNNSLPNNVNPYIYNRIDPMDNRYDFRTGEKVRDILINSINPVSNSGLTDVAGGPAGIDAGRVGFTSEQIEAISSNRSSVLPDGTKLVTNVIQTPAGPKTIVENFKIIDTPAGPQEIKLPNPLASVKNAASSAVSSVTSAASSAVSSVTSNPAFAGLGKGLKPPSPQDITKPLVQAVPRPTPAFIIPPKSNAQ